VIDDTSEWPSDRLKARVRMSSDDHSLDLIGRAKVI